MLVGLIIGVSIAVVNAHASEPQTPIDKSAAIMIVMTVLIVLHRLFF